jgi:hypothetical protein
MALSSLETIVLLKGTGNAKNASHREKNSSSNQIPSDANFHTDSEAGWREAFWRDKIKKYLSK